MTHGVSQRINDKFDLNKLNGQKNQNDDLLESGMIVKTLRMSGVVVQHIQVLILSILLLTVIETY